MRLILCGIFILNGFTHCAFVYQIITKILPGGGGVNIQESAD